MTTAHDYLPHPVPPIAFLRWKENWFFIVLDPEHEIHGVIHCNFEPGHERARFSCELSVREKLYAYRNETPFPERFAWERSVGDGRLTVRFPDPGRRIEVALAGAEIGFELEFAQALPTFDFAACRFANPDIPSFQEIMTFGMNLPYNHQQQALLVRGSVSLPGERAIAVQGYGYRDHSWCMRADVAVASHTWAGIHFGQRAFGVKRLHTRARPEVWAREGYVSDREGERVLRRIEVIEDGSRRDGLPARVVFELADVFANPYCIVCDLEHRYAQVPLISEKPGRQGSYRITENFCPARLEQTGETGCALVELGSAAPVPDTR